MPPRLSRASESLSEKSSLFKKSLISIKSSGRLWIWQKLRFTVAALQWFLDEQVEEEKVMTEAMGLVRFAGDDKSAMLALNQQFGAQAATAAGKE